MKTYTLFLPDITEEDLLPDGSEFDEIADYEDYESLALLNKEKYEAQDNYEMYTSDSESDSDSSEYTDSSEFHLPEAVSPKNDFDQSTFQSLFLEDDMEMNNMVGMIEQYDEVPEYYVDAESWIKSTNNLCISCSNKIQGMPMFIPGSWHNRVITKKPHELERERPGELNPLNNFQNQEIQIEQKVMKVHRRVLTCHERCSKRYIQTVKDSEITDKWQCLQLLKELVKDLRGIDVVNIEEGLDKSIMMQYCGPDGISAQKFNELNAPKI